MFEETTKGEGTRELIRDRHAWINRQHVHLIFHLTLLLSGHGAFQGYINRMGIKTDLMCTHYGSGMIDGVMLGNSSDKLW